MQPRTPEEWKAWRREVRQPWVERAEDTPLMEAFACAQALGGATVKLSTSGVERVGPCPDCGGKDRFSIHSAKRLWNCRGATGGHSPVSLVMHCAAVGFLEAVEALAGEPDPARRDAPPPTAEEIAGRAEARAKRDADRADRQAAEEREVNDFRARERAAAVAICESAVPWISLGAARPTPVELYLRHRKLIADDVIHALAGLRLRWRMMTYREPDGKDEFGRVRFIECGRFPVMVAGNVRDGALVGAHLTYLDPAFATGAKPATAKGKAEPIHPRTGEVLAAKKFRGTAKAACIRLFGPVKPRVLVRAEGIETLIGFLVALIRTGRLTADMGFWTAGSLDNLGGPHAGMVAHPTLKSPVGRALRIKGPAPRAADDEHPAMAIPETVERMLDLADADGDRFTVEQVLARSRARWETPARPVIGLWPPDGLDWAQAVGGV